MADASQSASSGQLVPLTPEYRAADHKYYVELIEGALGQGDRIKNIAVTGGYGVGKSSVLRQVASLHKKKVVEVSLSTLGLPEGDGGGENSTTNRIQKEIVKQLLYRERPEKMRGSRFRRLGRFGFWRGLATGALGGLAVWLTFFLAGWTGNLAALFRVNSPSLWFQLVLFIVLTAATFGVLALAHNRIAVKSVKVATADIALSSASTTYFDQYLDEIIYFFEVTKRDLVIFEDIDRFDDPQIFETLRALNTLLNASKQLSRSIRFIYAIKDSIFAILGSDDNQRGADPRRAVLEVAPANRTKFFDIVIPIVPFITHRNARELVARVLSDVDAKISPGLIDLCSRHLTDMRLVKNIRNEFVVFRKKVAISQHAALTDDRLLAMMLYKNLQLADFEQIPAGQSKLDKIYDASRRMVRQGVSELDNTAAELTKRLTAIDGGAERSEELGSRLAEYAGRLARQVWPGRDPGFQLAFGSITKGPNDDLGDPGMWRAIADAGPDQSVVLHFSSSGQQVAISKTDLSEVVGDPLSSADWDAAARDQTVRRLQSAGEDREFLVHASYTDLLDRPDLVSFEDGAFRGVLQRQLGDGLARELIEGGFLDQNFVLYTSNYYADRVSIQALNFILRNVDRNVMDVDYVLATDDVQAILAERGDDILRERCAFNVSLLDQLLSDGDPRAEVLLATLSRTADSEASAFWTAYLAGGQQVDAAISRLAPTWPKIITFLVNREDLDDTRKTKLVDLALGQVDSSIAYAVDSDARTFIERVAPQLGSLTREQDPNRAESSVSVLGRARVRLASLGPLSEPIRCAVVRASVYEISAETLRQAAGGNAIALDQLRDPSPAVYQYMIENIRHYLNAQSGVAGSASLVGTDSMPTVLNDLVENATDDLSAVIDQAAPSARVSDLATVPKQTWPVLAASDRFPTSYANVVAYLEWSRTIDQSLGSLLARTGSVTELESIGQAARAALGVRLLSATSGIPDPAVRVTLVAGLGLDEYLAPSDVPFEDGPLAGLLLEHRLIEDNQDSFALVQGRGWDTVGPFVETSVKFSAYMTPEIVPAAQVVELLQSPRVDAAAKDRILEGFDTYLPTGSPPDAIAALARYALGRKHRFTQPQILRISAAGIDRDLSTNLLALSITGMTIEDLSPIADAIGGWFKSLFARDGKRPKIKNTAANRVIATHLKEIDEVSSFKESMGEIEIRLKRSSSEQ